MTLLKIKILYFLFIVHALSVLNSAYGQNKALQNTGEHSFNQASPSYYKTDEKYLSIHSIIEKYAAGEFRHIKQPILNAGIPKQYYWFHFNITNNERIAKDFIINIDNARLNELELFERSSNTVRSLGKTGDFYPFGKRAIPHKNFIYEVSIPSGHRKEYFIFINQVGHTFTLPVKIYTAKNFRAITFRDYLFSGITYGILLFVAVVSFLFFFTSRRNLYLYYALYIVTAIGWFLSYFGLGYQYIWGNHPAMNTAMSPAMASGNILLNLQICQILLKLSKTQRLLNNLANLIKVLLAALAVFPFFINLNKYGYTINHTYLVFFLLTILIAMMIVSFSVIFYAVKGFTEAKFYLFASLLKAGSIVNLALLELGLTPAIYYMEELLQIGIFIEITLLTYAIASRYTDLKVKTFVRVIEAHENERALISKEIHDCISNSLTGINFGIENFTRDIEHLPLQKRTQLEKIFKELNKVQVEARNISHNTMPDYIRNSSITEIVEKHVEEIQQRIKDNSKNIIINFSANKQLNTFSETVKLNIFRIVQEILTNMLKHSHATNADVLFSFSKKDMLIIAEDNGIGFSFTANEKDKGMGVKNIRTRVELLDGNLTIKSPAYKQHTEQITAAENMPHLPEYGTVIKIRIPYWNNLKNNTSYDY